MPTILRTGEIVGLAEDIQQLARYAEQVTSNPRVRLETLEQIRERCGAIERLVKEGSDG